MQCSTTSSSVNSTIAEHNKPRENGETLNKKDVGNTVRSIKLLLNFPSKYDKLKLANTWVVSLKCGRKSNKTTIILSMNWAK